MRILGCLGSLLIFFFLLGFMALGSFLLSVRRLFSGGAKYQQAGNQHSDSQRSASSSAQTPPDAADYHFQPDDGEYIDFEEVKSERQGDE